MRSIRGEPLKARTEDVDAVLPQTQCTRCGEPDCLRYAEAIVAGRAEIDRCPPGGAEGVVRLAAVTGRPVRPLDPACGTEGPLRLAVIDEAACIGCTLCIEACPVDCIIGAAKRMHTVMAPHCTGCELCLPVCPVDCIALVDVTPGRTGWQAWSASQAESSRARYAARTERRAAPARSSRRQAEPDRPPSVQPASTGVLVTAKCGRPEAANAERRRRATIDAALARARALRPKVEG